MYQEKEVSKLIIAHPGNHYLEERSPLLSVACTYTNMAITAFDKIMSFDKEYDELKEIPDYETDVAEKEGVLLRETVFCDQPVIKVNGISLGVTSSSYIFNPVLDLKKIYAGFENQINLDVLYLPDLEVVDCSGSKEQVDFVLSALERFYRNYNWKSFIFDGTLRKEEAPRMTNGRLESLLMYDAHELRELAAEEYNYKKEVLYFLNIK